MIPQRSQYRLRTFATLALLGPDDDTVLGNHGHHRRRLALLAVLAAAGESGKSRDQLLLLFWPDTTQPRARHSLDQLLYALRRSIGDAVFASTNPVRLASDVIASDVGTFNAALERGDLEAAVDVYRGPFLDGFHVGDPADFERWLASERARLAASYADALERLARSAEAARDHGSAVRWWRKLVESDPVSSQNATGLIRGLMNAGDHPAALQYAERYEAVIAHELGTNVGPAVASLVAEARAEARAEPVSVARSRAPSRALQSPSRLSAAATHAGEDRPARSRRNRSRRYALGPLALGLLLVATAAILRATTDAKRRVAREPSIAVLPFANVSRDSQDTDAADGFSEELTAAMWRIPSLRVIARNSAFAFRNSDADVRRIGDSLGATDLLEGSVRRDGSRLRVQVRLVNARDGSTRWSETYDRTRDDIFAVQSEIAASVARELNLPLAPAVAQKLRRGPTQNIAAYELFLRGRDPVHMRSPTDSGPRQGLALLQQAVALDPGFAAAYASMPYMYYPLAARAANVDSVRTFERLAGSAARKALSLDPSLPEAYAGLGVALSIGLSDLPAAESALRRAIELGGSPRVREHLSRVLMWSGRHAEALTEAVRAADEDPLSASAAADLGEALCVNRRYDEGLAQLRRVSVVRPPLLRVKGYLGLCYAMQGMWPQAVAELRAAGSGGDPLSPLLGYALARSGAVAEARAMQSLGVERWRQTGRGAYTVALIAAGLGQDDQAFEWLARSADDLAGESSIMYPVFEKLQADARFERFRVRLGGSDGRHDVAMREQRQ